MAAGAMQRAAKLLLAALVLLAAAAPPAAAQPPAAGCTLVLPLNASASTLSLDGSAVTAPLTNPLAPAVPGVAVGMEGALTLTLPGGGPCPTTADAVVAALPGATLQTGPSDGPLLLYPSDGLTVRGSRFLCRPPAGWQVYAAPNPTAAAASWLRGPAHPHRLLLPAAHCHLQVRNDLVNLTLRDNFFQVSSSPLAAAPAGAGAFSATLSAMIVNGTVLSASILSPTPETLSMVGLASSNTSAVTAVAQARTCLAGGAAGRWAGCLLVQACWHAPLQLDPAPAAAPALTHAPAPSPLHP